MAKSVGRDRERLQPRQRLDLVGARVAALAAARAAGRPMVIWEHVGGDSPKGPILPTGRLIVRDSLDSNGAPKPSPKWGWAEVEQVQP